MKNEILKSEESKILTHIKFVLLSNEEIVQQSVVKITNTELYSNDKKSAENGILDKRMGPNKKDICVTCGEKGDACIGHFGHIELSQYIFPYPFLRDIVKVLKCICKMCGNILLKDADKPKFDKMLSRPNLNFIEKKKIRKEIIVLAKKTKCCLVCNESNGDVTKVKSLSMILHKKYMLSKPKEKYRQLCEDLPNKIKTAVEDGIFFLRPSEVFSLFQRVPVWHYKYLGIERNSLSKLSDLIFRNIVVPPNCIRPSTKTIEGSREDSVTINLRMMVFQKSPADLHNDFTRIIKPSAVTMAKNDDKQQRGLVQRLAGKKGRFRGNLMGKRTNFTARTVISPDPTLRIDEVSLPLHCALILTCVERVTQLNIDVLRVAVLNGPYNHPGATRVMRTADKDNELFENMNELKLLTNPGDWDQIRVPKRQMAVAATLAVGDYVERHIRNGDLILFNRQPSLHRPSIQSFSVVVKKERTLSFNPCCCNPFNADFDGDEMNVHFPQTQQARAECMELISSVRNLTSPNSGEPLTSPIQDIITGNYLMTGRNTFLNPEQFNFLAMKCFRTLPPPGPDMEPNFPTPAILKPRQLYTGKQLMSLVISPWKKTSTGLPLVRINMSTTNKMHNKLLADTEYLNDKETTLVVHNSELLAGQQDKLLLGGGSKVSLFYRLLHDSGSTSAARSMERASLVSLTYLMERGLSIGIDDVRPSASLNHTKQQLMQASFADCDRFIEAHAQRKLAADPGCNELETLEARISSQLSRIRDEGGKACLAELPPLTNAPLIMSMSGSKGSFLNISQMVFCVGQQIIEGKRCSVLRGLDKTMIYCRRKCQQPESRGFVANSFYSGLNPVEWGFHSKSGREGLVDTAVKTAETGYMQRRLIKCLEDLRVEQDGSVRDVATGNVVQFCYGVDRRDPALLDRNGRPCVLEDELHHIKQDHTLDGEVTQRLRGKELIEALVRDTHARSHQFPDLEKELRQLMQNQQRDGLTEPQLTALLDTVFKKYDSCIVDPGTPVGVICGQSVGEPATQMTLKTFHFAGVSSMSITQGVPRMTEILNAVRNIRTPIITAHLLPEYQHNETIARKVQMMVQPVFLRDVALHDRDIHAKKGMLRWLLLSGARLQRYGLDRAQVVARCSKLRLGADIEVVVRSKLAGVHDNSGDLYVELNSDTECIRDTHIEALLGVQVSGLANVKHSVIQRQAQTGKCCLYVEGGRIKDMLGMAYIDPTRITCNDIMDKAATFGVEAARQLILNELSAVMAAHNLTPDMRHIELLADNMTFTGEVQGFQRSGMERSKNSVLCLASFEKTLDHLTDAAYHSQCDEIAGVTDCITFGKDIRLGTGMSKIMTELPKPRNTLRSIRKRRINNEGRP